MTQYPKDLNSSQFGRRVSRVGDTVLRPTGVWTPAVHRFLTELRENGFEDGPVVLGIDEYGSEILSFIDGRVGNYPLDAEIRSTRALVSSAHMLRRYHDASRACVRTEQGLIWQHEAMSPVEVICHSDFAPYNIVFVDGVAIGLIDFDDARPGPRAWDLAYALYRFAPLTSEGNPDGFGELSTRLTRVGRFLGEYGTSAELCRAAVEMIVLRLRALIDLIDHGSDKPESSFNEHAALGHRELYIRDIEYVDQHLSLILDAATKNAAG